MEIILNNILLSLLIAFMFASLMVVISLLVYGLMHLGLPKK